MKPSSAPRDCADLAPFLTALFDGEADADAAAEARAHLLRCQGCARLWLDWNQHRHILRNESVPAPPPTLLWRVLLACRVAGEARPARRRFVPRVRVAPVAAPLRELEAPLPPRLSAHILERTSRAPRAHVLLTPTESRPNPRRFTARQWSLMAAPALALWLLLLGRSDFLAPSVPTSAPTSDVAISNATVPAAKPLVASVGANKKPVANAVSARVVAAQAAPIAPAVVAAVSAPRSVTARPVVAKTDEEFSGLLSLALDAARHNQTRAQTVALMAPAPRVLASRAAFVPRPEMPAETLAETRAATPRAPKPRAPQRRASLQRAATLSRLRVITVASARRAPATLTVEPASPRPRVTRLSTPIKGSAAPETALRVSRPAPSAPVLLAANFGGDSNVPRVDDLRSAVDDFRAAISDDSAGDE